jgi:type I restriction enzyme S subunit
MEIKVLLPPEQLTVKYELHTKPINDRVIHNCKEIYGLEKMRDMLLPKLMNGEVKLYVK